ncbi:MAG: winged helix-turn-helix domain-containing protein [Nitrososphaerales archaeon]
MSHQPGRNEGSSPDIPSGTPGRGRKHPSRRSRAEIMFDILTAVKGEAEKPTRIMYRSNLSWSVCQDLLRHLTGKGLIKVVAEGKRKRYELTPQGRGVLTSFTGILEELGERKETFADF